jgi:hypothetical protein
MSAADGPTALEADRGPAARHRRSSRFPTARFSRRRWSTASSSSRAAGFRYRDQAVLCRGNDRLSDTGQELERAGVPVLFLGSLFERTEVKDLVAMLLLLVDKRAMGLIRTACWPEFAMTLEDAIRVFERFAALTCSLAHGGRGHRTSLQLDRAALAALSAALDGFDATSQPWTVLATLLLDRTRLAARIASSSSVPDQAQGIAIWQFMNFVRVQPERAGPSDPAAGRPRAAGCCACGTTGTSGNCLPLPRASTPCA